MIASHDARVVPELVIAYPIAYVLPFRPGLLLGLVVDELDLWTLLSADTGHAWGLSLFWLNGKPWAFTRGTETLVFVRDIVVLDWSRGCAVVSLRVFREWRSRLHSELK